VLRSVLTLAVTITGLQYSGMYLNACQIHSCIESLIRWETPKLLGVQLFEDVITVKVSHNPQYCDGGIFAPAQYIAHSAIIEVNVAEDVSDNLTRVASEEAFAVGAVVSIALMQLLLNLHIHACIAHNTIEVMHT
jgi:hypothetical protein